MNIKISIVVTLETRLKSPDVLAQAFSLGPRFFHEKLIQCIYFHV